MRVRPFGLLLALTMLLMSPLPGRTQPSESSAAPATADAENAAPHTDAEPAPPAPDAAPHALPAETSGWLWQPEKPRFAATLSAGYALRVHEDGRSHGAAAQADVELPLAWGFGLEALGYGMGWGPSEDTASPLGLFGGALNLIYAFDDTDTAAIIGIGPTYAVGLWQTEQDELLYAQYAGAMLELRLRMPLGRATGAEAVVRAPIYLWGPEGFAMRAPFGNDRSAAGMFPSQFSLSVGLAFEPMAFFDEAAAGTGFLQTLLPAL